MEIKELSLLSADFKEGDDLGLSRWAPCRGKGPSKGERGQESRGLVVTVEERHKELQGQ